ncbi:S9 family peptidase [Larkinella terrae]|uniref:Prolyl oligopeptidase family serine peptidase n=1 Tax=Larkinella terrae TaxID=2025311 RepID=A0A7K0EK53_9BACT|nr:S9 family peptidase [Larkinella terrae]MRS62187.1 prolyl oligopeptidase family serine peptidase [Larkinella terrae]
MKLIVRTFFFSLLLVTSLKKESAAQAQGVRWTSDGKAYLSVNREAIVQTAVISGQEKTLVSKEQLTPAGATKPLTVAGFAFSSDSATVLIFTNTARVWRYNTRGDYYLLNRKTGQLRQVGKGQPGQSLLYAKISPDGTKVAYVSKNNLFVEDIATEKTTPLTTDGTRKRINGTFDWAYEEEFGCRDGFRWSPDSKQIAYWQVDASTIRDYLMLNTTDSVYSRVVPVEYPKVGESPSPARIGVVPATGGATLWLAIPGDPQQHYLVRMEWFPNTNELIIQQLNRKQNRSILFVAQASDGSVAPIHEETSTTWIDTKESWNRGNPSGWEWLDGGKSFIWVSEKDGWRHLYQLSRDGKKETLLTPGAFDIATISAIDEKNRYIYFIASPNQPTQRYLYRTKMEGKGKLERISPASETGTHSYDIAPGGQFAQHSFNSHQVPLKTEWVRLSDNQVIRTVPRPSPAAQTPRNVEFFTVKTSDGITLDGWIRKPVAFDSTKKYPVVFYVYGEPASTTTNDVFSAGSNAQFDGDMAKAGYCYVALDNRGTPTLKGAAWRKAIYRQIGRINVRDQAMGAKKLFEQRAYLDTSRVAVWGWSGGGSTTLQLLFQYPEIYKTGIAIAAVGNQLFYDNIYQERYMGLPQENREDFVAGSPITYAKNLRGNLLYIHGTGDDNVHYSNAEVLINELIKHNKQFQVMPYPNRTHSISEGEGTTKHLRTLYTNYLLRYCPPGPR